MDPNTDPGQHPNPGEGGDNVAANPDERTATAPEVPDGQGNGDTPAASAEDKTGDGQEPSTAEGAPEAYTAFDLPEGYVLEGDRLAKATEFFKTQNMTQAQAQDAVRLFVEMDQGNAATLQASMPQAIEQHREQLKEKWLTEAKAEFGDKYEGMLQQAYLAVQATGSENLKEAFNEHGWGNHPELIRAFAHFGSLLGEKGMDTGKSGEPPARELSLEQRMYPSKT